MFDFNFNIFYNKIMSLTNFKEVQCECGEKFTVELVNSINAEQTPQLKEKLLAGELNLTVCPKCHKLLYVEQFILYIELNKELIVFIYPKDYENDSEKWEKIMNQDFQKVQQDLKEEDKIKFSPIIIFGLEKLVELLNFEELQEEETEIVKYICQQYNLKTIELSCTQARKEHIPRIIPLLNSENKTKTEQIIDGLEKIISFSPDLVCYKKFLEQLKNKKISF